jgi:hypothetical protein
VQGFAGPAGALQRAAEALHGFNGVVHHTRGDAEADSEHSDGKTTKKTAKCFLVGSSADPVAT